MTDSRSDPGVSLREALLALDRRIWRMAYAYSRDPDEAADLAQEIRLRVLEKAPSFSGRSSAETWVYRVAINKCRDFARAKRRSLERETAIGPEVEAPVRDEDAAIALREALSALGARQRQLVSLREFAGLPYRDIAEVLGVSVGTVESGLFDARRKLLKLLAGREAKAK